MTKDRCLEYIREDMVECEKAGNHDEALGLMASIGYIEQIDEPYWHTEEPNEEGWYLKWTRNNEYTVSDLECTKGGLDIGYVIAWHKIPTYQG